MLVSASQSSTALTRVVSLSALCAIELLATRLFAPLPDVWGIWPIVGLAHAVPKAVLLSAAIFLVISWPKRADVFRAFNEAVDDSQSLIAAATSATALLVAVFARTQLALAAPGGDGFAAVYAISVFVTVASLILVVTPFSFWRTIVRSCRFELILALAIGTFGLVAGEIMNRERGHMLSEEAWAPLTDATVWLSYWILRLFDPSASLDPATRVVTVRNFQVFIATACSGYEGMILISTFLFGYFYIFRRSLKFPNVLILLPLAMGTIWLLNSLRIALLVYIGGHLSSKIALGGFHSQFGWISFLLVAISIMTFAQRIAFFGTAGAASPSIIRRAEPRRIGDNPALIYLAPFVAAMAAQILTGVAAPHEYLLYPMKVVAIGAVLYGLRSVYARMRSAPDAISLGLGAIAGVIWIATDPNAGTHTALEASLSELAPTILALWLIFRAVGTIVMVPVAEELAFRGFLYRTLLSSRFEAVDFRAFGLVALVVSSALFGILHDRWLAAFLAGLLYALIMMRRGKLADAVAAHMTTNAIIFAWAVAAGQWSLL